MPAAPPEPQTSTLDELRYQRRVELARQHGKPIPPRPTPKLPKLPPKPKPKKQLKRKRVTGSRRHKAELRQTAAQRKLAAFEQELADRKAIAIHTLEQLAISKTTIVTRHQRADQALLACIEDPEIRVAFNKVTKWYG